MLLNIEPILHKIRINLEKCGRLKLTLWGKVNVIKMVVAPQFNYVSIMLLADLSTTLLKNFDNTIKTFLLEKKRPRINTKKMRSSRDMGGVDLPNVPNVQ